MLLIKEIWIYDSTSHITTDEFCMCISCEEYNTWRRTFRFIVGSLSADFFLLLQQLHAGSLGARGVSIGVHRRRLHWYTTRAAKLSVSRLTELHIPFFNYFLHAHCHLCHCMRHVANTLTFCSSLINGSF